VTGVQTCALPILDNQVLKSKTCDIVFVFFLEKSSFSAIFVGVKEEKGLVAYFVGGGWVFFPARFYLIEIV
jgi:hypothetical protein